MKIKTQFSILIIGIIIIPILITLILYFVFMTTKTRHTELPTYNEIFADSESDNFIDSATWRKVIKHISYRNENVAYAVFDSNFTVIVSNNENFIKGNNYKGQDFFSVFQENEKSRMCQLEFIADNSNVKDNGAWIFTSVSNENRPGLFISPFTIVLIIFTILFVFCLVMISVIADSIANSIMFLEDYTRHIASGQLDVDAKSKIINNNEIVSLTNSINTMREKLLENDRRKTRFIMGISHDLRTPIALIKGYAEALNDNMIESEDAKHKSFGIIIAKSDTLSERIDEMLDFIKLDTHEWQQNLIQKPFAPFLRKFLHDFMVDAKLLHRFVHTEICISDDVEVAFDEKLFTRVLENLATNACRYTQENGNIWIKCAPYNDKIALSVSDDGCGIKQEDLPYIFDPLYRGTNSRREDGKGLGLSVVKSVVESHGWEINATSTGTGGAVFTIMITK